MLDDSSPDERLNIRSGPGTNNPVVGQLAIGELFIVVEGPACSNRYTWYRVLAGEVDGWVAEGDFEEYYVAPYLAE